MFKFILKPRQILKLSFAVSVAQRKMLGFNVLIFVSMRVLTAAARKSEGNLCASKIFSIFFLKRGLLVPATVALWLSRINLALKLLSELLAVQ